MRNKPKWYLLLLFGLVTLLASTVVACEKSTTPPSPTCPEAHHVEGVIDALDTAKLLHIGYNHPGEEVVVEGIIVRTHHARSSKGKPTFLNFHDPYQGYFKVLIWEDNRDRFIGAFPPNPETYFLSKRVRVKGSIEIYKGDPEVILSDPSQIWIVE